MRARRPTASAVAIPYSTISLFCWSREQKVWSSTSQGRAFRREGFHGAVTIVVLEKDANASAGRPLHSRPRAGRAALPLVRRIC